MSLTHRLEKFDIMSSKGRRPNFGRKSYERYIKLEWCSFCSYQVESGSPIQCFPMSWAAMLQEWWPLDPTGVRSSARSLGSIENLCSLRWCKTHLVPMDLLKSVPCSQDSVGRLRVQPNWSAREHYPNYCRNTLFGCIAADAAGRETQ